MQVLVSSMQISSYIDELDEYGHQKRRKWFFDNAPFPLPEVGDFIDTAGGRYYTNNKERKVSHTEKQGFIVKVITRIFSQREEDGMWNLSISGV